ncbi:unnamed protein product [Vicia faba]|uniref:Growth-regulating factor n=1 Tax=Vicia faba TaxID=3906 RepID=A0AAV1A9C4_VICFA|nr:unnamed protein product [Vicia faba]
MDLGVMSLDGLVSSDPDQKTKWFNGSGLLKQERSGTCTEDELLRTFKLAKTDQNQRNSCTSSSPNSSLLRSNVTTLFSDAQHQQQMLSFSTPNPKSESFLLDKNTPTLSYPYHQHHNHHHNPMSSYNRTTGYGSGSMHGGFNGVRGPFTPSQWMELEHQALIYKYITANVAVPHHLLIPIRKALDSAGLSTFSSALLRPNAYAVGWGGFHLGYSNNTDPEPGRCRRTDGKKWRCSRDAVVDQKYCERHMNRGRHRSRKPVEGQSGQALTTGGTTNTATTNVTSTITTPSGSSKQINVAASPSSSIVVPGSNNATNTLSFAHQEHSKNMNSLIGQDNASSAANTINRMFMNSKENNSNTERMQDGSALPMLPPTLELKPKDDNSFMIQKQHISYDESSRNNEFGFVTSDSLLNPSQKPTTLLGTRTFGSSSQNPTNRDVGSQHSLRHFIDDFPKTHSDNHNHHNRSGGFSWPELDMQSDRTQLSISTPLTASDFMSFPSSATNEKLTLSPLRLSREIDPIQMGLGVGNSTLNNNESSNPSTNHPTTRQANWIPITWESSMGGPLGEVLHLSNIACNASDDHYSNGNVNNNNSSALNLMTDGWDNHNSPPMGSSPTGVLQKTAFGSLSNSSAGSSPRAENNKTQEGASLCNDHLGSTLGNNNTSFTP